LRLVRLFFVSLRIHFKELSASSFQIVTAAIWPLIFATLAYFMFRAGSGAPTLLYASLGAAVLGIWSLTASSAGAAIQRQRWQGILELLVAAPAPFFLVLAPITVAISALGVYSIASTILWGRLLFGVPLHVEHLLLFAVSIPLAILSIGMLGLLLASTLVVYRSANAFSVALEYPVWLITGLLVPISLLPGWVAPIAWALAPTWGMRAMRNAALGGPVWPALAACLALSVAYAAIAYVLLGIFERRARERATLSLT
jgi:ABC-type polysaccharide/polyol phosphate export permease